MNTIEKNATIKRCAILIACMIAYGSFLLILASGHFSQSTVVTGVQCLNALGFFLAIAALLKK